MLASVTADASRTFDLVVIGSGSAAGDVIWAYPTHGSDTAYMV
jgi:hypothetical protein